MNFSTRRITKSCSSNASKQLLVLLYLNYCSHHLFQALFKETPHLSTYYDPFALICDFNLKCRPFIGVLKKRCSENIQQIYRRTPRTKSDFNNAASNFIEIKVRHRCSPVNLLNIFRTPFSKNTSGWLLLYNVS